MGVVIGIYVVLGLIPGIYWAVQVGAPKAFDQLSGVLEVGGAGSLLAGCMVMVFVLGFFLTVGVLAWPLILPSARRFLEASRAERR